MTGTFTRRQVLASATAAAVAPFAAPFAAPQTTPIVAAADTLIVDSHNHAWSIWPYNPPVPDPTSRGLIEQLLWEMDRNGVAQAVVICANIDHNPDDNGYVAECLKRIPNRLIQFIDVDSFWLENYHKPGAATRLTEAVRTYNVKGFTHYIAADDDGSWYLSDEGLAFFRAVADLNLIASIHIPAKLQPVLRQVATRFPSVPILCHHMAYPVAAEGKNGPALTEIVTSAALPNIHIKLSGFHYATPARWEYPFSECRYLVETIYKNYGPERIHWGSDYPVSDFFLTYQQTLEAVRTHCSSFIPPADMTRILGMSLRALLDQHGA